MGGLKCGLCGAARAEAGADPSARASEPRARAAGVARGAERTFMPRARAARGAHGRTVPRAEHRDRDRHPLRYGFYLCRLQFEWTALNVRMPAEAKASRVFAVKSGDEQVSFDPAEFKAKRFVRAQRQRSRRARALIHLIMLRECVRHELACGRFSGRAVPVLGEGARDHEHAARTAHRARHPLRTRAAAPQILITTLTSLNTLRVDVQLQFMLRGLKAIAELPPRLQRVIAVNATIERCAGHMLL